MKLALTVLALVAALIALDRAALWAEARGWIYWRRSKRKGSAAGSALLDIGAVFDPGTQHMVDVQEAEPTEETTEDELINPPSRPPGRLRA